MLMLVQEECTGIVSFICANKYKLESLVHDHLTTASHLLNYVEDLVAIVYLVATKVNYVREGCIL